MRVERMRWDGEDAADRARAIRALVPLGAGVADEVARIVADVRARGDAALRELSARLDATDVAPDELVLRVEPAEIERARAGADPSLVEALEVVARNIRSVAEAELEASGDARASLPQGQTVDVLGRPVRSVGVYAPGGRAPYPSSVLMCCLPARVAGVDRVALATPPGPDGRPHPATLTACSVAGVDEVYALGGAQAVAAFAYGTETVAPVDVVAGPGSRFVNEAKRAVFGDVGVDGVAGPSELVAVLDDAAKTSDVALDLLAQAEHGRESLLVAISASPRALDALAERVATLAFERGPELDCLVAVVDAPDLGGAIELADALAPEHLELALEGADRRLAADRIAGAVFFGPRGAVAFGDYAAGSNHVLPTGAAARFAGPLGVGTFRRRTSVVELSPEAVARLGPSVAALARAEGFELHAESAKARTGD